MLFNCVIDEIFREFKWEKLGFKIDGGNLTNLRFANDGHNICGERRKSTGRMMNVVNEKSLTYGLKINFNKTKFVTNKPGSCQQVEVSNGTIEWVSKFVYLWKFISIGRRKDHETHRSCTLAWGKYWSLKSTMKSNLDKALEIRACTTRAYFQC